MAYALLPYSFEFSATTFVSSSPHVSYTLTDGPEWLDIDTANRRLSGTPRSNDVGVTTFQLTASDVTGDATDRVTFVVLESTDLIVREPITEYLLQIDSFSSPNSLLLRPSQPFAFKFDPNLFLGTTAATRYYATSADDSPLPSWLQFDNAELRFSGDSPPLLSRTAPAQEYGLRLIASNVPGFAEAIAEFHIVIQLHVLAFSTPFHSAVLSIGEFWRTESLRESLMVDGQAVVDDQILSMTIEGPSWVQLDEGQISLSGWPEAQVNTTITISVTDIFNDVANATWVLEFEDLRPSHLGVVADIEASAGEYFVYTFDAGDLYSTMQLDRGHGNELSWLQYNATNFTLYGEVPLNLSPVVWNISISFQNMTTNATGILILHLAMSVKPTATTPIIDGTDLPRNPSASIGATATSSNTTNRHASKENWNPTVFAVSLAVVGGVAIFLIISLVWLHRRRRREKQDENNRDDTAMSERIPSNGDGRNEFPRASLVSILEHPEPVRSNPPLRPPRIDLAWSNDSFQKAKSRLSGSKPCGPQQISGPSSSDLNQTEPRRLRNSMQAQSVKSRETGSMRERQPLGAQETVLSSPSRTVNSQRRLSDARATGKGLRTSIIHPSMGLPKRRSGAGHGSGIIGDTGLDQSQRDTWAFGPLGENHRSTVVLDSFPIPPSAPASATAREKSPLGAMFDALEDSLSFEAQRQRWHTERARARLEGAARFSNRGSSRIFSPSRPNGEKSNLRGSNITRPVAAKSNFDMKSTPASMERSWSNWSGIGSAARDLDAILSPFEATNASIMNRRRGGSVASSRQFDSAASSDSQWEDESPSKGRDKADPRLPFSPLTQSQEIISKGGTPTTLRQGRVADKRNAVNVEALGLTRTQNSQQASLRYI